MSFTPEQIEALSAPLSKAHVKERTQAGRQLSYIEAWHAIAEANRIFGFDGWERRTVELRQLGEPRVGKDKYGNDQWRVGYMAKVRIHVFALNGEPVRITREGCGFGSGIDKDPDQAHESALKEAESDAMKRALMTFGNPFGLALYDKTQANVVSEDRPPADALEGTRLTAYEATRQGIGEAIKGIIDKATAKELDIWEKNFDRNTAHVPLGWLPSIRERIDLRREELANPVTVGAEETSEEMDEAFRQTVGSGRGSRLSGNASPVAAE